MGPPVSVGPRPPNSRPRSPDRGAATSILLATADTDVHDGGLSRSDETPEEASPAALDAGAAARLWDISAQLASGPAKEKGGVD